MLHEVKLVTTKPARHDEDEEKARVYDNRTIISSDCKKCPGCIPVRLRRVN
jgi:hypothetical protein